MTTGGREGLLTVADRTNAIACEQQAVSRARRTSRPSVQGWSLEGDLEIFERSPQLRLQWPEAPGPHTLAGFLLERLQHIPSPGEGLRCKRHLYRVLLMAGPRMERVQMQRLNAEA